MLKVNQLVLIYLIKKTGEEMLPCSIYVKARKPKLYKVLIEKSK
jgi:hypothetical protein